MKLERGDDLTKNYLVNGRFERPNTFGRNLTSNTIPGWTGNQFKIGKALRTIKTEACILDAKAVINQDIYFNGDFQIIEKIRN